MNSKTINNRPICKPASKVEKNTDFAEVMAKHEDEDLILIATFYKDDYQPLAVAAAQEEIKKRGITADIELINKQVCEYRKQQQKEQEQKKSSKSNP